MIMIVVILVATASTSILLNSNSTSVRLFNYACISLLILNIAQLLKFNLPHNIAEQLFSILMIC